MRDTDDCKEFRNTVRRAFARLTREELPAAAVARGWPVRTPEEFEQLLLEHLRDGTSEPAPEGAPDGEPCIVDLILAVELGERLLAGNLCCVKMNRRLRCAAATGDRRRADALKALFEILEAPHAGARHS